MSQLQKIFIILLLSFNYTIALSQIDTTQVKQHIETLSSDAMEGRLVGSKGEKKASEYITNYFKELSLIPLQDKKFEQPFSFNYQLNPHNPGENLKKIEGINVVGKINNGRKHTFVIGAHYDHLGYNEYNLSTDSKGKGMIHNGADDNASGVAAVLELANIYSNNDVVEPVNFIFACFSGEELGLMGSKSLAKIIKNEYPNVSFMINFDMIGRMDSTKTLNIGGVGTSPRLNDIVFKNKPSEFKLKIDSSGVGPSDHTSFYLQNIPVLFFFTGLHTDYHKPSDDADKINYVQTNSIIEYAQSIIDTLSINPVLKFNETKFKTKKSNATFKVTLGIFPDYTDYGDGLHIQEVLENRTAQKYGLQKGDIITKIDEFIITEIYSYMECLSKLEDNKTYKLTYIRNYTTQTIKIKF
ncbi:M20/M25/M40 family metallo-hydrolase [Hyunsoonleella rubra]